MRVVLRNALRVPLVFAYSGQKRGNSYKLDHLHFGGCSMKIVDFFNGLKDKIKKQRFEILSLFGNGLRVLAHSQVYLSVLVTVQLPKCHPVHCV